MTHEVTSTGKVGFATKVKTTVKVSCWLPLLHAQRTEQQLTVVCILALVTYIVQEVHFQTL